jgi:hypothetical protein
MKFGLAVLCSLCFLVLGYAQDNAPPETRASFSIGLEVGQKAPTFSSTDQFGHEQSNQSLLGTGGTVLLFFRSADW